MCMHRCNNNNYRKRQKFGRELWSWEELVGRRRSRSDINNRNDKIFIHIFYMYEILKRIILNVC